MLDYPLHKKLKKFKRDINHLYKSAAPLYEIDGGWDGFVWVAVDEKDNNVIAFNRKDKSGNTVTAIINFSGYDFNEYRLGVDKGEYKAVLCSDDKKYGGNGLNKKKTFKSVKKSAHGKEYSIRIKLPRFTGIYFIKKG